MTNLNLKETFFGFTNGLKPMQAAKIEKSFNKLYRYDGKVMQEKEWLYLKLLQGYTPAIEENYSYYSRKTDSMTKPKTLYKIETEGYFNEINKTLYNYALHIINNNFLDPVIAADFITKEKQQKEEAERIQAELEAKEKEEKRIRQEQKEKEETEERKQKQAKWLQLGKELLTDEYKQIIINLVETNWNDISVMYTAEVKETFLNKLTDKFTLMLGNQAYCETWLKYYQEEDYSLESNPVRYLEKSFLQSVFKIDSADQGRTISAKVKAFYNGNEYKGSTPVKEYDFYILNGQQVFEKRTGVKKVIEGITCYLHFENERYIITEAKSGLKITSGTNKQETLENAKNVIVRVGERIHVLINKGIERSGISPLYRESAAV